MAPEDLRLLYGYDAWANRRILDYAERLTPEQLHEAGNASFSTIFATLVHTMDAEASWLGRWRGIPGYPTLTPADFADFAAFRARWEAVMVEMTAFVAALTPEGDNSPARVVTYANRDGETWSQPLWQMMAHVANHNTQHRSEVAAMLTQFGHSPGELDLIRYIRHFA